MRHPFVSDLVAWIVLTKIRSPERLAGCFLVVGDLPNDLLSVPTRIVGRPLVTAFARRRSVEA